MQGLDRLLAPLRRRVALMVGRAIVTLVDDAAKLQGLQVTLLADELRDHVEHFQPYGLTAHPHPGAEAIAVCVAGSRDHAVVIALDDRRYRLTGLAQGEVALYDDLGQSVHLTRAGIVVRGAGLPVTITDTSGVTVESSLHVTGAITTDAGVTAAGNVTAGGHVADQGGSKTMAAMRGVYNDHHHGGSAAPDAGM